MDNFLAFCRTMFLVLILSLCVTFAFALWSWIRPRRPSPPMYPGALPIIGHGHLFLGDLKNLWKLERKMYNFCTQHGGVIEIRIGPFVGYVLTDPEDSILIANNCLDKPHQYQIFVDDFYGNGLVTAKSTTWKHDRKILNTKFNQQILNMFVEDYSTQAKSLLAELDSEAGKGPFDVMPHLMKHMARAVYKTTFGIKADDHEQQIAMDTYTHATDELLDVFINRFKRVWLHLPFLFKISSWKKKQDVITTTLKNITNGVINKRKSELKSIYSDSIVEATQAKSKSLLDAMLDMAMNEGTFTDDEVRQHLDTVVAAAYDTTTKAMTYFLILIGSYPDVQSRIFKELQEVFDDLNSDITKDDLPKLVYLEAVMKESLRLYSSAPRFARYIHSDVKLKNFTLPAGTLCIISGYGINRHPVWGSDAEQFRPERWLDPATLPDNPYTFASFSIGRRNCIGKQYGMMAMKTMMACILRRYSVTADINKVEAVCDILLKPVSGHHISLELRTT